MPAANLSRRAVQEPFRAVRMGEGAEEAIARTELSESASGGAVQVLTLRGLAEGAELCGATKGSTLRALFPRVFAIVLWKNLQPPDCCVASSTRDCRSNL